MDNEQGNDEGAPQGRLDTTTLRTIGRRTSSHPLVTTWAFNPSSTSPRILEIQLADDAYPPIVDSVRIDVRWFTTDDYSFHYVEQRDDEQYQCRWDRHPKTSASRSHFHPPPDAGRAIDSPLPPNHLEVCFTVLDWVSERVQILDE